MEASVDLMFHYMGTWVFSPHLRYAGGETNLLENFDVDFLSYTRIRKQYINHFGYSSETKIYVLKPGKKIDDGLLLIEDDEGIKTLTKYLIKSKKKLLMHIYAHDVDDLPYFNINELLNDDDDEAQRSQIGTQYSYAEPPKQVENEKSVLSLSNFSGWVGNLFAEGLTPPHLSQLLNEDTCKFQESWGRNITDTLNDGIVSEHVSFDMNVENDIEDVIGQKIVPIEGDKISTDILEDGTNTYDSSLHLTDAICDDSDKNYEDSDEEMNDEDQNSEDDELEIDTSMSAKSLETYNSHFMLGMTFSNANEARDAITRYSIQYGYDLKLKPNEPYRLRAKCKGDGCSFELFISKEGKNGGLMVKKLLPDHNCYRVFKNSLATAKFLAKEFKHKLYKNPSMKVKDLIDEAETGMKLNVSRIKCKRAKRIVMNELDGSYQVEFSQLAVYADAMKRMNPGTTAEIDLCKEGLHQGKFGYVGDGYNVQFSSNLPFKAPGLKWHGEPCTTSRQLQEWRQQVINKVSLPQKDKKR